MKVLSFFTFIEEESKLIELQMMIWEKNAKFNKI